jgi:hypothetical protein
MDSIAILKATGFSNDVKWILYPIDNNRFAGGILD